MNAYPLALTLTPAGQWALAVIAVLGVIALVAWFEKIP